MKYYVIDERVEMKGKPDAEEIAEAAWIDADVPTYYHESLEDAMKEYDDTSVSAAWTARSNGGYMLYMCNCVAIISEDDDENWVMETYKVSENLEEV